MIIIISLVLFRKLFVENPKGLFAAADNHIRGNNGMA